MRNSLTLVSLIVLAASVTRAAEPQLVKAELKADRVIVTVAGKLFTEYLFSDTNKYPYFYPVLGPRTGLSVTTRGQTNFPHHSSIFFGCDRVNGGNYWQEGLARGRIASKQVRIVREAGSEVVLEQDCLWQRPGAEAPFEDHRRITVSAPAADLRCIDFEVTLTARNKVRIEKTNHSLFSGRVAPELSVQRGGRLVNAHGDESEKGTFGKPAPWADYRGRWHGETEGVAIFNHPQNRWSPPQWFTRDYGFFSPTPLNWLERGFVEFAPGEKLHLRYRVVVHAGAPDPANLQALYDEWSKR